MISNNISSSVNSVSIPAGPEHGPQTVVVSFARNVEGEVETSDDGRQHAQDEHGQLQSLVSELAPLRLRSPEVGSVVSEPAPRHSSLL